MNFREISIFTYKIQIRKRSLDELDHRELEWALNLMMSVPLSNRKREDIQRHRGEGGGKTRQRLKCYVCKSRNTKDWQHLGS